MPAGAHHKRGSMPAGAGGVGAHQKRGSMPATTSNSHVLMTQMLAAQNLAPVSTGDTANAPTHDDRSYSRSALSVSVSVSGAAPSASRSRRRPSNDDSTSVSVGVGVNFNGGNRYASESACSTPRGGGGNYATDDEIAGECVLSLSVCVGVRL